MHVREYVFIYIFLDCSIYMHAYTYIRCIIIGYDVQKSEEMPTAYQKQERTKERHNDRHNLQRIWGFESLQRKKIKHLSEVITQRVCAHKNRSFRIPKFPNDEVRLLTQVSGIEFFRRESSQETPTDHSFAPIASRCTCSVSV
jgi:hypothetical protein